MSQTLTDFIIVWVWIRNRYIRKSIWIIWCGDFCLLSHIKMLVCSYC